MEYILKENADGEIITVRDLQLELLKMLEDVDKVCKKHNISYVLNGGSALGTVRHQGFIPWDDDIDLAIMRQDFDQFIKVIEDELSDSYVIQCFKLDKNYNVTYPAIKIRKKNTYIKERNTYLQNRCLSSDGIFIDVFVFDYQSSSRMIDFFARIPSLILAVPILLLENLYWNPVFLKKLFYSYAIFYGRMCRHSNYIGEELTWIYKNPFHPYRYQKDTIFPETTGVFEGKSFPIPKDYTIYLTNVFGPDWSTIPKNNKWFAKHAVDINLNGSDSHEIQLNFKKDKIIRLIHSGIIVSFLSAMIGLLFWGDITFICLGFSLSLISIVYILYWNFIKNR